MGDSAKSGIQRHYSVTLRHRDNLGMYPNSKILKTFEELAEQ
jgi:hypothetical protein